MKLSPLPPDTLQSLLHQQELVGWHRFFESWVVKGMGTRTATLIFTQELLQERVVVGMCWDTAWDLWEHHNGILHDTVNAVTQAREVQLNRRVMSTYLELCSRLLWFHDRHLIQLSLSQLMAKDFGYKETWLSTVEPALRIS